MRTVVYLEIYLLWKGRKMPQLSLYINDASMERLRRSAHEQGVSLSRCAAEAINARCSTGWPEGYFELYGALADGSFVAPAELDYALDAPRKGW